MKYLGSNVTWTKAAMLSETGFLPKIVKLDGNGDGDFAHAWLEVPIRLGGGETETLIVDPSNGRYILNYNSVLAIAPIHKSSYEKNMLIR